MNNDLLPGRTPDLPVIVAIALTAALLSSLLVLAIFGHINSAWFMGWFAASAGHMIAHFLQKRAIGNSFNQFLALSFSGVIIRTSFILTVIVAAQVMKVSEFATIVTAALSAYCMYMAAEIWIFAAYSPHQTERVS
jgi:hypothetical protein